LRGIGVDRDDLGGARDRAPWIAEMPTPPQPITTTELPGVIFAVLIAAPTPVGDAAADQRHDVERDVVVDFDHGALRQDHLLGERAAAGHAADLLAVDHEVRRDRHRDHRLAEIRLAAQTRLAQAARGRERDDRVVAGLEVGDARPTSSTMPAPSWPSTHGVPAGIVPFCAETSEWHTPLDTTLMCTSPGRVGEPTSLRTSRSLFSSQRTAAFIDELSWIGARLHHVRPGAATPAPPSIAA
jgi:hypothetical protein